jgi:hypothetical protein
VITGYEYLMGMGLHAHPPENRVDFFWRTRLREIASVDKDVALGEWRECVVSIVRIRDANDADRGGIVST